MYRIDTIEIKKIYQIDLSHITKFTHDNNNKFYILKNTLLN